MPKIPIKTEEISSSHHQQSDRELDFATDQFFPRGYTKTPANDQNILPTSENFDATCSHASNLSTRGTKERGGGRGTKKERKPIPQTEQRFQRADTVMKPKMEEDSGGTLQITKLHEFLF